MIYGLIRVSRSYDPAVQECDATTASIKNVLPGAQKKQRVFLPIKLQ